LDTKTYLEQKEAGLATLVATGTVEEPTFTIVKKNWNPDTGEQTEDTFTEMKLSELLEKKADLTQQLKDLNAFIAETKTVEPLVEETVEELPVEEGVK